MTVHTAFALIQGGEVKNTVIGEYYDCDQAAKTEYGSEAFAIEITQIPAQIGDTYDGDFWREENGEKRKLEWIPTSEEIIASLNEENKTIKAQMNIIMAALTDAVEMMEGEDEQ